MILTATKYYEDLSQLLRTFSQLYMEVREVVQDQVKRLNQYVVSDIDIPDEYSALQTVLTAWIKGILETVSLAYQGESDEVIDSSELKDQLIDLSEIFHKERWQIRQRFDDSEYSYNLLIDELLERYRFDLLVRDLTSMASKLEERGLNRVARQLVNKLNLKQTSRRYGNEPKQLKRFYQFQIPIHVGYSNGYDYDLSRGLLHLAHDLTIVEKNTGAKGLSYSVKCIAEDIQNAKTRFDSRTRIGEGNKIDAIVFNSHMALRVPYDAADAIFAFIRLHSDIELISFDEEAAA